MKKNIAVLIVLLAAGCVGRFDADSAASGAR